MLPPAAASSQVPGDAPTWCDGLVVSEIVVRSHDPSFLSFPPRLRPFARAVGLHHTTSREGTILSFVLLEEGEECTEQKRAETERILRLQPFLADATVRAVTEPPGGVRIEIETTDEIPTVFGMRFRGMAPSALRVGNANVDGQGIHLSGRIERGFAYRTAFGIQATAYQSFGRPYTLSFVAERARLGSTLSIALGHPFLTDLQRTAWHVGSQSMTRYLPFLRPDDDPLFLKVERNLWNIGGVRRLGVGRYSAFVGGLVTAESVEPARDAVIVSDSGLVRDETGALGGPSPSYRNLRVHVVMGVRALSFMPVRGFDALEGTQDMATGLQLGAVVGQGISWFGAREDDFFLAADLYAGHGSPTSFGGLTIEGQARRDPATRRWDSALASGRLAWYFKPAPAHLLITSVELGAGWRQRVPFQLALGDREGGVRGYASSRRAGAVRTVVRLEERWAVGPLTRHGSFGVAGFVDGGRVWAGDAPFGADSGARVGIGVGLLAAFPPESRRLWRLDVAFPASSDPDAGWEVRFASTSTRSFWREPRDVARGRAGSAPSTIFAWP